MSNPQVADLLIEAMAGKATVFAAAALAANERTTSKGPMPRGVFIFDAQWTGSATVTLQSLGADGVTWRDVCALTAPGTFGGEIRIGAGAVLAIKTSAAITAFSASIS